MLNPQSRRLREHLVDHLARSTQLRRHCISCKLMVTALHQHGKISICVNVIDLDLTIDRLISAVWLHWTKKTIFLVCRTPGAVAVSQKNVKTEKEAT